MLCLAMGLVIAPWTAPAMASVRGIMDVHLRIVRTSCEIAREDGAPSMADASAAGDRFTVACSPAVGAFAVSIEGRPHRRQGYAVRIDGAPVPVPVAGTPPSTTTPRGPGSPALVTLDL